MACRHIQRIANSLLLASSLCACMGVEQAVTTTDIDALQAADIGATPIALSVGTAAAGVDERDGFCENGLGVYLSATADSANLTLYVVTPAEAATFEHPVLHLTTFDGESEKTIVSELETVTLIAGESRSFSEHVEGTLVNAVAEVFAE